MRRILFVILALMMACSAVFAAGSDDFETMKKKAFKVEGITDNGYLEGMFEGSIYITESHCILNDNVPGDLFIEDSTVSMGRSGSVSGKIYVKNSTFLYDENEITADFVIIEGDSVSTASDLVLDIEDEEPETPGNEMFSGILINKIIFYLILFCLTGLIRLVLKDNLDYYFEVFSSYAVKYLLLGLGFWILLPVIIIIFTITVIGIPVMLFLLLLLVFAMLVGFIVLLEWTGRALSHETRHPFAAGFLIFSAVEFIATVMKVYVTDELFSLVLVLLWGLILLLSTGFALHYIKNLFKKKN